MKRYSANGHTIIQVRGIEYEDDPEVRSWTYAWAGSRLEIGDQFLITIGNREWEVVVVAFGTEYEGYIRTIGGKFGLTYGL